MRRRVRLLQGAREPASPPADARLVPSGGHAIWWTVEAATEDDALRLLPLYVAERTTATSVSEVEIP